jgi:hypothetical protein
MGHWFPATPLEALEAMIMRSWLIPKHQSFEQRSKPGAVVADAMKGPLAELIQALRPEHMLTLRDDAVWPRVAATNEHNNPWRPGQVSREDISELKLEFDRVLAGASSRSRTRLL